MVACHKTVWVEENGSNTSAVGKCQTGREASDLATVANEVINSIPYGGRRGIRSLPRNMVRILQPFSPLDDGEDFRNGKHFPFTALRQRQHRRLSSTGCISRQNLLFFLSHDRVHEIKIGTAGGRDGKHESECSQTIPVDAVSVPKEFFLKGNTFRNENQDVFRHSHERIQRRHVAVQIHGMWLIVRKTSSPIAIIVEGDAMPRIRVVIRRNNKSFVTIVDLPGRDKRSSACRHGAHVGFIALSDGKQFWNSEWFPPLPCVGKVHARSPANRYPRPWAIIPNSKVRKSAIALSKSDSDGISSLK